MDATKGTPPITCKVELLVSALQGSHLDGQSKICSWARNYLIDEVNQKMSKLKGTDPLSEEEKERILKTIYTEGGIRDLLPLAKVEHPHLKLVYSSPLKNVGLNLAKGIKAHQAGRSEWIRRKKWKLHWTTLEYDEVGKGWKVLETVSLVLNFSVFPHYRLAAEPSEHKRDISQANELLGGLDGAIEVRA